MMTMKRIAIIMLATAALLLTACSGTPMNTTQQVDTANIDFSRGRKVSASASGFQLLLFIPISINSRHERAYRSMLSQANGDYVTDIKIDESWTYAFVGTIYKTTIEGMAYPQK